MRSGGAVPSHAPRQQGLGEDAAGRAAKLETFRLAESPAGGSQSSVSGSAAAWALADSSFIFGEAGGIAHLHKASQVHHRHPVRSCSLRLV